jgi:site-specific recombinase XerD
MDNNVGPVTPGTVEIRMSALRFLYKKTLKRRDLGFDDLVYPKRPQRLPLALSPEEVTRLIEATPHPMHRAILMVLYGTGIRTEALPSRSSPELARTNTCNSCPSQLPSGAVPAVTDRCPCWNA